MSKTCIVYLIGYKPIEPLYESLKSVVRSVFPVVVPDILIFYEGELKDAVKWTVESIIDSKAIIKWIQWFPSDIPFTGKEVSETDFPDITRRFGYLRMCRFFSGEMQTSEVLREYDYYMRLDDDSVFTVPGWKYNYFEYMKLNGIEYLFRQWYTDTNHGVEDCYHYFVDSAIESGNMNFFDFDLSRVPGALVSGRINMKFHGMCPYNNFHISSVSFWRRPDVRSFIYKIWVGSRDLHKSWMDANFHFWMISYFLKESEIAVVMDFGYRHNTHFALMNNSNILFIPEDEVARIETEYGRSINDVRMEKA